VNKFLDKHSTADSNKIEHLNLIMGNAFVTYVVIVPMTIIEVLIFWFCKTEAEER